MRPYKLIGCESLREETERVLADIGGDEVGCEWLPMGLHERPDRLHAELADRVAASGGSCDAVLLLFGLCSRATAELEAPAGTRLVIPRVHDCVALLLGSAGRYRDSQAAEPGTLWLGRAFLRSDGGEPFDLGALGAVIETENPDGTRKSVGEIRRELCRRFGEDGADHLVRELAGSWQKNYARAVYLERPDDPRRQDDMARARALAARNGWRLDTETIDTRLIRMLVTGDWPDTEFIVVSPGRRLAAAVGDDGSRVFMQCGKDGDVGTDKG